MRGKVIGICLAFRPRRREVCGVVSSNSTILRAATACRQSAFDCARGGAVLARELCAVSRQLRHLCAALLRPAADASLRSRLFDFSRRREPVPVCGDRRAGGRDDLRRNAVGPLWTQGDHDSLAGRRCGGDACRLPFAELDDVRRAAGADRPRALRRSGGGDGLSGRRDGSLGDRTRDGPLYRRQHAGRFGRPPGDRRVR